MAKTENECGKPGICGKSLICNPAPWEGNWRYKRFVNYQTVNLLGYKALFKA